jgi:hypothetical protein
MSACISGRSLQHLVGKTSFGYDIATMTDLSSERERYGSEVVGILQMAILVCK